MPDLDVIPTPMGADPKLPVLPVAVNMDPIHCNTNGNNGEMEACAALDMAAAFKDLNSAVAKRWAGADEKTRLLLANAEASWLRAAQDLCRWDADANRGGSLTRLTVPYCMADLARRQTQVISKFRDEGNG